MKSCRITLLLILVTTNVISISCCSREPCLQNSEELENHHDREPPTQSQGEHKSHWSPQVQLDDSLTPATGTTTHPIKSVVELVRGELGTTIQSNDGKEVNENRNIRGEERKKRHVHLDLGEYGYEHHAVPLFGYQDYNIGHGFDHYDHFDVGHHHHSHHHH